MISVKEVPREKRSCLSCKFCSFVAYGKDSNKNPAPEYDLFYCEKDDELQYRNNEGLARTHCRKWEPEVKA